MANADAFNVPNSDESVNDLCKISPKDKPWDTHRSQADDVQSVYATAKEFERYSVRIGKCSGILRFGEVLDKETGEYLLRLRESRFCRVRHCPICQWRRSLMWQARFYQYLPKIQEDNPKGKWLLLTLTVRNCPIEELGKTIQDMNGAWQRLSQRKEFSRVLGWVRTTEVTRGKDGSAHPHFHALLLVPPSWFGKDYVAHARWVELWQQCARLNYAPNVDIRTVKPKRAGMTDFEALSGAVQETLKYAVKPSDMTDDPDWFLEMTKQVHKKRFIATGGVLKDALRVTEETEEDLLVEAQGTGEESQKRIAFAWNTDKRKYRRSKAHDD